MSFLGFGDDIQLVATMIPVMQNAGVETCIWKTNPGSPDVLRLSDGGIDS